MPSFGKLSVARPSGPVVAPPTVGAVLGIAVRAVGHLHLDRLAGDRGFRARELQRDAHRERDTRPEHILPREHPLLAAALVREPVVDPERPVRAVRIDLLVGHALEEVVVDPEVAVGAVDGEAGELGRIVERASGGRARLRLGGTVSAVARVCAGGLRGHVVSVCRDRSVEDRLVRPLHAEVHGHRERMRGGSRDQRGQNQRQQERCTCGNDWTLRATPSSGVMGLSAGVRSPGFELRAAPSRRAVGSPVATCDASAPVHSGGTARDSHPTSLDHRPLNASSISHPRKPTSGR